MYLHEHEEPNNKQQVTRRLTDAMLDQVDCGIVACDATARILHCNRAARREFENAEAFSSDGTNVRCIAPKLQANLLSALHDATKRHLSRLIHFDNATGITVFVAPLAVDGNEAPAALLMMSRRSVCSQLGVELLAGLHGLTFAERRIVRGLTASLSPIEIAAKHSVTIATVRTQLRSIREKVGVANIDALLLRIALIPPVASSYQTRTG